MRSFFIILLSVAAFAGCRSNPVKPLALRSPGVSMFPVYPPIADANASVRHSISVRVPTELEIHRTEDSMAVGYASFQAANVTVGSNMITGIEWQHRVYRLGDTPPQGGFGLMGGTDMESHLNSFNYVFRLGSDKIPQPGEQYVVEYRLTIFETDLPPQHMWSPHGGKHYQILWTRTFTQTVP